MGFPSLCAMAPDGSPARAAAEAAIARLAAQHGAPRFPPHATVLGGVSGMSDDDARARCQELCRELSPYTLSVERVAAGTSFFQCVYLLMQRAEEALDAHWQAKLAFGMAAQGDDPSEAKEAYMPHVSLMYGDIAEEAKEGIVEGVEHEHADLAAGLQYPVASLALWRTDPDDRLLGSWECIGKYQLSGNT